MKRKYLFLLTLVGIALFSCTEDSILFQNEPNDSDNISTRAGGDGNYDVLGYGYDCTQSDFVGTGYARLPVIDVNAYTNAGNIIHVDRTPNEETRSEKFGSTFDQYQKNFQTDWEISNVSPIGSGVKLFTGKFKVDIAKDEKITTSHAFYEMKARKGTRMVRFDQTDPFYFKDYLTSSFKYDLSTKSGIEIVRKYGTHVLTDIKLGGSCTMLFYAKMKDTYSMNSFKTEVSATYWKVKVNGGTNNKTTTLSNHKDMQILVYTVGGSKSVQSGKLTFNPFEGSMNNLTFNYNDWLDSVKEPDEHIIGISNPNTKIHLISEFIFDNPQKKKEVEDALTLYAEEQSVKINKDASIDYMTSTITAPSAYLAYTKTNLITFDYWYIGYSNIPYYWTFFPEGNYYRIRGADGYLTRVGTVVHFEGYANKAEQLWEISKTTSSTSFPYNIKDPQSNQVLTRWPETEFKIRGKKRHYYYVAMELWNPYNDAQYWNIK